MLKMLKAKVLMHLVFIFLFVCFLSFVLLFFFAPTEIVMC